MHKGKCKEALLQVQSPIPLTHSARDCLTLLRAPFSLQSCLPYRLVKIRSSSFMPP